MNVAASQRLVLPAGAVEVSSALECEPQRLYTLVCYSTNPAIELEVSLRGGGGTLQHQENITETRPVIYAMHTKEPSTIELRAHVAAALPEEEEVYVLAVREITL